jgi:hypothetical protein
MTKTTDKGTGAAETKSNDKGRKTNKTPKLETGYEKPENLFIVGLDEGFREGEPGWDPELQDPDRLTPPDPGYVATMIKHGHDKPAGVVYKDHPVTRLPCKVIFDGRQHVMGARLANAEIVGKAEPIVVAFYVKTSGATALDVTRANEWARRDSPLVKAKRAVRLAGLGYKEAEIIEAFSDDGARPITKMTLINWKRAANCCQSIQDGFSTGEYPITILYEIGKIKGEGNTAEEKEADKAAKQIAALETIKAAGGTLKGKTGRDNASGAAESAAESTEEKEKDESSESGKEGGNGGTRPKSTKLNADALRELATIFESDSDEPFTDMLRTGRPDGQGKATLEPSRQYQDGDYQALASALFAVIVGDDPTGESLSSFPSVYKHVRKYLRSETE